MTLLRKRAVAIAVGSWFLATPFLASGQDTPSAWTRMRSRLQPGKDVRVVLTDGREHRGIVQSLSEGDLLLLDDRVAVRLERDRISRVSVGGDSLVNGLLIGALGGGAGAAAFGGYVFALCANEGGRNCPSMKVTSIAFPLTVGIGLGVLIDASNRGSTVVYRQSSGVTMAPIAGRGTCGIGITVPLRR